MRTNLASLGAALRCRSRSTVRGRVRPVVSILIACIPIVFPSNLLLAADADPDGLFAAVAVERSVLVPADPTAIRTRFSALNLDRLPKIGSEPAETVRLNLFPNANYVGIIERVEHRTSNRYTLSGRLAGSEYGRFIVVREGDVVAADIHAHDKGIYEVRPGSNGLHVVRQVNESALRPCGFGPAQTLPPPRSIQTPRATERVAEVTLDVMVVYTAEARVATGGTAAMEALIQLFVAAANTTYANSLVNISLRLVYAGEVAYNESGSAMTDLNRLTFLNDGYLEEVHALRDQYGADVVSLLVNDFDYCGIAWLYFGPTRAFSVVDFGCGSATFVHEIGHNMGCAHDHAHANAPGEFTYSYGHRFNGQSGTQWRTVMSYAPGMRIQHFSNPAVAYDGASTGIPEGQPNPADNARTVNNTSPSMANYRPSVDMVDCNGNFQSDAEDIADGTSQDCNGNDVPDECDVASGSPDINGNNVPDECECDASNCEDGDLCTLDRCDPDNGACLFLSGGIPFGDLNYSGNVDVGDVNCVVAGFGTPSACPDADVAPCGGDGHVDVSDILMVLNAFSGLFECPSLCP